MTGSPDDEDAVHVASAVAMTGSPGREDAVHVASAVAMTGSPGGVLDVGVGEESAVARTGSPCFHGLPMTKLGCERTHQVSVEGPGSSRREEHSPATKPAQPSS